MSMFRAKTLDLGGHLSTHIIRDHTKRKVFAEFETERYGPASHQCDSVGEPFPQAGLYAQQSC